jgi:hypothetical protein
MRFSLAAFSGFLLLSLLATVQPASAQISIFLTPVPNAPFTAVVDVQRTYNRSDGPALVLKSTRNMARDGIGRIRNELRTYIPATSSNTPELARIHLYDPRTRVSTEIDAVKRTFFSRTLDHPPSTVPPTVGYGSPTDTGIPHNEFSKAEDLGSKEIEGVLAHGVRESQVIPAEGNEAGKEITITEEYWYSDELHINVVMKHSDPRTGTTTLKVTHIVRGEPDPALLEIPEGYTRAGAEQPASPASQ